MKPLHHGCRALWHYSLYPLFITTAVNVFFIAFLIRAAEQLVPVEPTYSEPLLLSLFNLLST